MTRRNLRKWAEAKQRRADQAAAANIGDNNRPLYAWWDEAPRFGMAVAPTRWIPMEPATADTPPPYTHTISTPPPTEYHTNGYPLPPRIQPSTTFTQLPSDSEDRDPAATFSRAIELLRTLYSLTPREVAELVADYGAQTPDVGHVQHGHHGDWFRSIQWSAPAWQALHGAEGPRKGRER